MDREDKAGLAETESAAEADPVAETGLAETGLAETHATATAEPASVGVRIVGSETEALKRGAALGRYMIVDVLGRGGMGVVYSAFDPDLDRKVAVKLLRTSTNSEARTRLLREAQAMAKLSHPNVVTVFEVGTDKGRDYVVMEYINGQHLGDWAAGKRTPSEVLEVYQQAGRGLAAAHRAGLVHRDFKPHNVLIDLDGRVRVGDFGLAQQTSDPLEDTAIQGFKEDASVGDSSVSLTRTGAVMGTPAYMAPEQHLAESTDERSDQFSFCVALFEALAGKRPYGAADYQELKKKVTESKAARLPESVTVSGQVRSALAKGLSRPTHERHESMDALLERLEDVPPSRTPLLVGAGVVAIAAVALVIAASASDRNESCQADQAVLAGTWDTDVQSRLRDTFTRAQSQGGAEVFERFSTITDQYAQGLVDMRVDICKSNQQKRQSDPVMVLRMECLQRRHQELSALTSVFAKVEGTGLDRVIEAALGMGSIDGCADLEALERGVPLPPVGQREEVAALQAGLKEAESLGEAGHTKEAIASAEAVQQRALTLAYRPLVAEVYNVLGGLYGRDVRVRDAEAAFEEAILAAEESGYDEIRARALAGLARVVAGGSSRFDEARRYARQAKAAIEHWGGDPSLVVDVDRAVAHILTQENDLEGALRLLEESLRTYRTRKTETLKLARLLQSISGIKTSLGDYEEAEELLRTSLRMSREELGEDHPEVIGRLGALTSTLRINGRFEEAEKNSARLRTFWASDKGVSLLGESEEYESKGRDVTGTVFDDSGNAVEGAMVVCGQSIVAGSRHLAATWSPKAEALNRGRTTRSRADGTFLCKGTSTKTSVVAAEDSAHGRSLAVHLKPGETKVSDISLRLMMIGHLSGSVSRGGKPPVAQSISAVYLDDASETPSVAAVTFLRDDGTYLFERLAPGRYKIFAGSRTAAASQDLQGFEVEIVSGEGATVDFDQSEGSSSLRIEIVGEGGAVIPSAQVLVVPGRVEAKTVADFNKIFVTQALAVRSVFWSQGDTLEMKELGAGKHSLCILPLGGDFRDPEYMKNIRPEFFDSILVYCQDVLLTKDEAIELSVVVPAMKPIVELKGKAKSGE